VPSLDDGFDAGPLLPFWVGIFFILRAAFFTTMATFDLLMLAL
jgi:hypothetical protein